MADHHPDQDPPTDTADPAPPGNPWDREAEHFDEATDHGLRDPAARAGWRELLLQHLPPPPARVVDLGCGTGSLAVLLAEAGYQVHGLDSSPAMLDQARTKATASGLTIELTQADVADPPLPAAGVDVVLCRHVLWAMPDPVTTLRRWTTLLVPGGCLVLIEGQWDTGAGIAPDQCAELLTQAGCQPTTHHLTDPTLWGRTITDQRYLIHAIPGNQ